MENNHIVVIVALVCLTVLEVVALLKGINGQLFTSVLAIIAGLAGFTVKESVPAIKSRLSF